MSAARKRIPVVLLCEHCHISGQRKSVVTGKSFRRMNLCEKCAELCQYCRGHPQKASVPIFASNGKCSRWVKICESCSKLGDRFVPRREGGFFLTQQSARDFFKGQKEKGSNRKRRGRRDRSRSRGWVRSGNVSYYHSRSRSRQRSRSRDSRRIRRSRSRQRSRAPLKSQSKSKERIQSEIHVVSPKENQMEEGEIVEKNHDVNPEPALTSTAVDVLMHEGTATFTCNSRSSAQSSSQAEAVKVIQEDRMDEKKAKDEDDKEKNIKTDVLGGSK